LFGLRLIRLIGIVIALHVAFACSERAAPSHSPGGDVFPTPQLEGITSERREVRFVSGGVALAGELDLPVGARSAPLVFVIHHSGEVDRNTYGYLAELLLRAGYAVFRFDKRGVGASEGSYGCCEADDALAAYRAAVAQAGVDRRNVFIVAQSIGTQHLADRYGEYAQVQAPRGVVLLSSLLRADAIVRIAAPLHIIVSDSEPDLTAIGRAAAEAHQAEFGLGASYYVADHTEHTLFDTRAGPIDWSDPAWVRRYHRGAMQSLEDWLDNHSVVSGTGRSTGLATTDAEL
jgi:pimeloyl-ACP methyl ester carboxylesterase